MTTMRDLVADAKRMAYGSMSETLNFAKNAASAGATTLDMDMPTEGIAPGSVISSGLGVWYVRGNNVNTKQLTVYPGYQGSPLVAVAADDVFVVKPRVTDHYVFSAMCDVIRSLSAPTSGLYQRKTFQMDVNPSFQTYVVPDANADMMSLLGARILYPGSDDLWLDLDPWMLQWAQAQGVIRVTRSLDAGTVLEFTYRAPFTVPTALTDDPVEDCGLPETAIDIPPLGAAISLLRTTESRRQQVQTQGDPRRATEVQFGANTSAANAMQRNYEDRVNDEAARLLAANSYVRGV